MKIKNMPSIITTILVLLVPIIYIFFFLPNEISYSLFNTYFGPKLEKPSSFLNEYSSYRLPITNILQSALGALNEHPYVVSRKPCKVTIVFDNQKFSVVKGLKDYRKNFVIFSEPIGLETKVLNEEKLQHSDWGSTIENPCYYSSPAESLSFQTPLLPADQLGKEFVVSVGATVGYPEWVQGMEFKNTSIDLFQRMKLVGFSDADYAYLKYLKRFEYQSPPELLIAVFVATLLISLVCIKLPVFLIVKLVRRIRG